MRLLILLLTIAILMVLPVSGCTTGAFVTEEYSRPAAEYSNKSQGMETLRIEKPTPLAELREIDADKVTLVSLTMGDNGTLIAELSNGRMYEVKFPKGAK